MDDLNRLRIEYADRRVRLSDSNLYSPLNPAYLFVIQQRQRALIDLLRSSGIKSFDHKRILEIGCGGGDVLYELMLSRIDSRNFFGIDLISDHLNKAKARFPGINLVVGDAQTLPYNANHFDLVLQFTVFSSILDQSIKVNIATEMLRVVKSGGLILWYDFWFNPVNLQTKGIRKAEIQRLFPNCTFKFKRVTLAPPVARWLVPISWALSGLLESLLLMNSHFLVAIQPK